MLGLNKEHDWKNATIMATASATAYKSLNAFQKQFDPEAKLFDNDGTQVYCWNDGKNACVAFRGTEPTAWSDIKADLKIRRVKVPTGFVHRGFRDALDEVWSDVAEWLRKQKKEHVFFTGHSLGGALATLAASNEPPFMVQSTSVSSSLIQRATEGSTQSDALRSTTDTPSICNRSGLRLNKPCLIWANPGFSPVKSVSCYRTATNSAEPKAQSKTCSYSTLRLTATTPNQFNRLNCSEIWASLIQGWLTSKRLRESLPTMASNQDTRVARRFTT